MNNKSQTADLLSAVDKTATPEEEMLSALQALIAAEIAIKRHEQGLTQKAFAEAMGVSQTLVSKWESGETNFTLKTLVQIASKLAIEMTVPYKMEDPLSFSQAKNIVHFKSWINSQNAVRLRHDDNDDSLQEM